MDRANGVEGMERANGVEGMDRANGVEGMDRATGRRAMSFTGRARLLAGARPRRVHDFERWDNGTSTCHTTHSFCKMANNRL